MRIAYCTNVRLPSERAHGHQIAQVCDAMIALGHEVTVFATVRRETIPESFSSHYGVSDRIVLRHIGHSRHVPNWKPLRPLRLFLQNRGLIKAYRTELSADRFDLLHTRTPALLSVLLSSGIPTILELHAPPRFITPRFVRDCGRCRAVACLTSSMRDRLVSCGVPAEKIVVEGDAVDPRRFDNLPDKQAARARIGLSTDRVVVGYVGRLKTLFMEKGVKHLLEALAQMKDEKKFFGLIVGGPEKDAARYRAMAKNLGLTDEDVRFVDPVPGKDVPAMLAACDALAMPFPDFPHYRHNMSPLKMFEYMAAGRPIVTSDLPSVRDVLSQECAFFCVPGDSSSLAAALQTIAADPAGANRRAANASQKVKRHTWEERTKRILNAAGFRS